MPARIEKRDLGSEEPPRKKRRVSADAEVARSCTYSLPSLSLPQTESLTSQQTSGGDISKALTNRNATSQYPKTSSSTIGLASPTGPVNGNRRTKCLNFPRQTKLLRRPLKSPLRRHPLESPSQACTTPIIE